MTLNLSIPSLLSFSIKPYFLQVDINYSTEQRNYRTNTIVFASSRRQASCSTIHRRSVVLQNAPWELENNRAKNCSDRENDEMILVFVIVENTVCLFTKREKKDQSWANSNKYRPDDETVVY